MIISKRIKPARGDFNWRMIAVFLLSAIPLIGWGLCRGTMGATIVDTQVFWDWTIISVVASLVILFSLKGEVESRAHLWVIYLTYLIGHYVQFYALLYWNSKGSDNILLILSRHNQSLQLSSALLLNIYRISSVGLCALAISFLLNRNFLPLSQPKRHRHTLVNILNAGKPTASDKFNCFPSTALSPVAPRSVQKSLTNYAIAIASIAVLLLVLTVYFRVGARIDNITGVGRVRLPFRLNGIITYSNRLLIPSIMLMLIYVSDVFRSRKSLRIAIWTYFLQALLLSLISTSRSPVIVALFSFATVSIFSKTLTKSRIIGLLSAAASLPLLFGIVTTLRFMRGVGEVGNLANLAGAFSTVISGEQGLAPKYLFFLMTRINGIDTLINIETFKSVLGDKHLLDLVVESKFDLGNIYTSHIIENTNLGFGASPGLTGALSMLSSNPWMIFLGVVFHVLLWHVLFLAFSRLKLRTKPMALAQVSILAGFYTSAGTFDKIPYHIALTVGIVFLCERIVKVFIGK